MLLECPGTLLQRDRVIGDGEHQIERCIRIEIVPVTVEPEEDDHERPRRPLVPIHEGVVANQ